MSKYPQPPKLHRRTNRSRSGASLLQWSVAFAVFGVVLASFVPAFVRSFEASRTSEAPQTLAELHHRAAAYFAGVHSGSDAGPTLEGRRCLPPSAGPTPLAIPPRGGRNTDFSVAARGRDTWSALGVPSKLVHFSYRLTTQVPGCDVLDSAGSYAVSFSAEGDLDHDGVRSYFERRAAVRDGQLIGTGVLYVQNRTE